MSDEEWGRDDSIPTNNWDDEDESDVKDAWDKSDTEEEKPPSPIEHKPAKPKNKKKIDEKKSLRTEPLTDEEKLAEKLRQQKMEETSKIELARNLLGIKEKKIDGLVPVTKEDFEQFGKAISEKIQMFSSSEHYSELIENITKEICIDLNTTSLKKVKLNIESLHSAKLKEEKALKSGKKSVKGKSVKMDLDKDLYGGSIGDGFDDMDDFM